MAANCRTDFSQRLCAHLPRAHLACLPTALEHAPHLSAKLGLRILVKREDLSGLCVGGNKARLLDLVMGQLLVDGVDTLIACASPQSNKLREIAAAAARCGMRAILLLQSNSAQNQNELMPLQGNRLLYDLLGAKINWIEPDCDALAAQRKTAAEISANGGKPAILDRHLDYGLLATLAYVDAAQELHEQFYALDIMPGHIFITAGAGMTLAGLALGFKYLDYPGRVSGICVARSATVLRPDIINYANRAAQALAIDTAINKTDFDLVDQYLAPGYGIVTDAVRNVIRLVATHHGMVLDPIYNAKTMLAVIDHANRFGPLSEDTCVYINTGGGPALFAYAANLV